MVLSEDGDASENVDEKFRNLCADLNIDRQTADEAWRNYETISTNYTLEVIMLWPTCLPYSLFLSVSAACNGQRSESDAGA